jgi:two-component system LytT family sensor kinase
MALFRRPSGSPTDALGMLEDVNRLSAALRSGFTTRAAGQIAETARSILQATCVAVTDDRSILATDGPDLPWDDAVLEQTAGIFTRGRLNRPTVYEIEVASGAGEVIAVALRTEDVPIGTIHVLVAEHARRHVSELRELASLVESQLQLAELEQSRAYAAEAELRALRAQISPHFLHNSLTAIAGLVNTDPARARTLIATFAEFLRASFRTQADLTTVSEELRLVEAYLDLEQARFGGRFDVALNIAPEALPVRVPFLTVQPVVENAITHGLEARPGAGKLSIIAENAGPEVAIHIEDDGVGIDPAQLERALSGADSTPHVGILAVDTRLRSTFGQEYGLSIETGANAGTKVTIRLPKYSAQR